MSYLMAGPAFGVERGYVCMALAPSAAPAPAEAAADFWQRAYGKPFSGLIESVPLFRDAAVASPAPLRDALVDELRSVDKRLQKMWPDEIRDLCWRAAAALAQRSDDARALADIVAERERQKSVEGWTEQHDDEHDRGELPLAAACYALSAANLREHGRDYWPWKREWWKPKDVRRDLVRAGALIVAEIERLDRAAMREENSAAPRTEESP